MKKVSVSYPQLTFIVTDTKATMVATGLLFKEKSINEMDRHPGMGALIIHLSL